MKLAYANYHDGIETRIFVKEDEETALVKDWEDHGVAYEFFTVSEESILARLAECHDVFEARWLMEEIDFWAEDLKAYNLPQYLTDAAKAIYAEDDGLKSAKATREFLHNYVL